MNIKALLKKHYQIGRITDIRKTVYGSGNTFIVMTEADSFIVKFNNKEYEIELYNLVQRLLKRVRINHPRVIKLTSGDLIGPDGIVMFEYIKGETLEQFNKNIEIKALKYISKYNQELKNVNIDHIELKVISDWDRIRSLDYICSGVPKRIIDIKIYKEWKEVLLHGIEILNNNKNYINKLPKQLIHSDLGADNFIILDEEIHAIIDFSPDIKNELCPLSHFIYWNYMWCNEKLEKRVIDQYFENYYSNFDTERINKDLYFLLLQASIFRVLGPLFEISKSENPDYRRLNKRIDLIRWIKNELVCETI